MGDTSVSSRSYTSCSNMHCYDTTAPPMSDKFKKVMSVMETVCFLGIAIFAAYYNYQYFVPFFAGGVVLGTYLYWNTEKNIGLQTSGGGCTQLFFEKATGVKLPAPLGLGADIAIAVCHIEHHAAVFVPLAGLISGMWIGKNIGQLVPKYCTSTEPASV